MATEGLFALLGTVLGGMGVKYVDKWLSNKGVRIRLQMSEAAEIRKELWDEVANLRTELRTLADSLDDWKTKYYTLRDDNTELQSRCINLESENKALKNKCASLEEEFQYMKEDLARYENKKIYKRVQSPPPPGLSETTD